MTDLSPEHLIRTRQLILAELTRRNIPAEIWAGESGERISIGDGRAFSVNVYAQHLAKIHPDDHEKAVWEQVEGALISHGQPGIGELSEKELLARVRTRLIRADEDFSYGRAFGEELIQVLCVDFPETVTLLNDESVAELTVPLDTLFEVGQANTDAEPVGELSQIEEGVYFLETEHPYLAAKAANILGLVENVLGHRPPGVVFGLLGRNALLFAVPQQPDPLHAVLSVAQVMGVVLRNPNFDPPGGVLSGLTYFYSPEWGVETFARTSMIDGQESTVVTPSETFDRLYGD